MASHKWTYFKPHRVAFMGAIMSLDQDLRVKYGGVGAVEDVPGGRGG